MKKQRRSINWLVVLLCVFLAGFSIWAISILVRSTQLSNTPLNNDSVFSRFELVQEPQERERTLVVGGDDSNPPYSYLQSGQAMGLDNDLMREIAKNIGMEIQFILSPLDQAKRNLLNGTVDVIGGMANTEQQGQSFLFGTPHAIQIYDLFVRRDSGIHSMANMEGRTLIIQKGDEIENLLSETGFTGGIVYAENPLEALTWLSSGQYDGVLIGSIQGYYLIKKNNLNNIKSLGVNINEQSYGFAVLIKNRTLLLEMNQALGVIETSGTFENISAKWLSSYQKASFFDKNEYLIYGFFILITLVLIAILWGWSSRRLVKRRTAELRASEKKYRQLIDSANEGVVILIDMAVIYLNPLVKSIFSFSGELPKERIDLLDHIHPLDHELIKIKYHQLLEGIPGNSQLDFRILTAKGLTRWVRSNSVKIDWEGQPALLSFITDITDERTFAESIKASEEQYRLIFDQSPVGMFYYNTDLCITNVNDRFVEILHSNREKLQNYDLHKIHDQKIIDNLKKVMVRENGFYEGRIKIPDCENRSELYVKLRTTPLLNDKLEYQGGIGLIEDITEQTLSEHKIKKLEEKFAKVFYTSTDAINICSMHDGTFIDINLGFVELSGYERDEIIGKTAVDLNLWVNTRDRDKLVKIILEKGECKNLESQFRAKDGKIHTGLMSASLIEIDGEPCLLTMTREIDDLKQTDELIKQSELRYRSIFESVPVSIWEQDLLLVYDMLENLRVSGVENLVEYMDAHPEFVEKAIRSVKILDVNEVSLKIYKAKSKEHLISSLANIFNAESQVNFKSELLAIWNHEAIFNGDTINVDLEGEIVPINLVLKIPSTRDEFRNVLVSVTDITQRKIAEDALLESESRYRQLVEQVNVVVYLDYAGLPSRPKYISPQIEGLLGYTQEEWLADPELMMRVIHPDDVQQLIEKDIETDRTGEPFVVEYRAYTKDGQMIWIHDEAILVYDSDGRPDDWHGVMYDITSRKMAEEALRESEIRYRTIFDSVPVSIKEEDFSSVFRMLQELRQAGVVDIEEYLNGHPEWVINAVHSVKINEVNQETLRLYKAESKEELITSLKDFFVEESYSSFKKELAAFWNHQSVFEQETINQTLTGDEINVWISIAIPPEHSDYSKLLVTIMDITERKKAEEQIRLQLRYLAALRAVDMAISASMDLPITLRVLLNQVHQQLLVDAVAILTLDLHTQTLKYAAGIGFETNAIETVNLRLGQSYAGQAALERRIVTADDLATKGLLSQTKEFEREGFTHYLGIPLVSKGTVKGVLELFNHKPFIQDPGWMGLLESMAGQAAIAIENATLMDEVQKVNINLRTAYDATIEGWARSIDLRTGDSEGHAQRVADLTIELAQSTGFQGEGLLNMRRGALLHDIGKIAIPDNVLLKPGSLNEDEWKVMKKHPEIAKRLLTSIDFLHSVIEIPYSHHEHWDGTGYPDGLAGSEIPFAARIFAVVDCWDSLRSDRPWRKAWTDENAWNFIESKSGTFYDPQIVEKFRNLLGHGFATYF